jgi:hypothetical protein
MYRISWGNMVKDEGIPVPSALSSASAESIELIIEDQAFLRSYDLTPPPPLSKLSLFRKSSCVSSVELHVGGNWRERAGGGARS